MIYQGKGIQRAVFTILLAASTLIFSASAAVVTSIRPLGFIAAAIADGVTQTEVLLPDGASPHNYALRPSDVQRLRQAELVLWVGPEMEAFLSKPLQHISTERQMALASIPTVQRGLLKGDDDDHHHDGQEGADVYNHDHHHGAYDMHIWMSPELAKEMAIAIHQKLVELSPKKRVQLDENLHQFKQQLQQSKEKISKLIKPVQEKRYYVFHDAYNYFENEFGLKQLGHFTVNPEIQPGAQRLHQIRTQLVEQKAICVFAEPQFRPAVIHAVVQGTSVRMGTLDPLGSGIALGRDSYVNYLSQISEQFVSCLKEN